MPGKRAPEPERREQILKAAFRVAVRERLAGLTIRGVAAEAKLSPGLVLFHFATREDLLLALLDRLLGETVIGAPSPEVLAAPTPRARLLALLRRELELLPGRRTRVELFFDFWIAGTRDARIRRKLRAALGAYRDAMRPLAEDAVAEALGAGAAQPLAADLAGLLVAVVEGYVIQAVTDPGGFDVERVMATVEQVVIVAPPRTSRPGPAAR